MSRPQCVNIYFWVIEDKILKKNDPTDHHEIMHSGMHRGILKCLVWGGVPHILLAPGSDDFSKRRSAQCIKMHYVVLENM